MLIKFYKEMFCKKEEKKEEKCPYIEYIEEQEKVLKRNDKYSISQQMQDELEPIHKRNYNGTST